MTMERAMTGAKYVASFLGREPGRALFVGLYEIGASRPLTFEQYWKVSAYAEMKEFGMQGFRLESGRESVLCFDLSLTDFYADWKGKLIVGWPPPERSVGSAEQAWRSLRTRRTMARVECEEPGRRPAACVKRFIGG